ncbi:MAG: septum formation initiator family protein [Candidatus Omnitrophica bacterium]|nr:septum formation initiator family protein [Candidatus Omnitrophota bacterium]
MKKAFWLLVSAIAILVFFLPPFMLLKNKEAQNVEYEKQIKRLQDRQRGLESEKNRLETDPVYLEKVGREKMGLIREGEEVVEIVPAETKEKE